MNQCGKWGGSKRKREGPEVTERDREALSRPVLKLYPKRKDTHLGRNDSKPIIIIFIFKSP